MAAQLTRVERAASIFQRITGLIRAGQLKWDERPMWYDVYVLCPPHFEPVWNIEMPKKEEAVRKLFYAEDPIRARFYRTFGSVGVINLHAASRTKPVSRLFVETYKRVQKEQPEATEDQLFEEATKILVEDGFKLKKRPLSRD